MLECGNQRQDTFDQMTTKEKCIGKTVITNNVLVLADNEKHFPTNQLKSAITTALSFYANGINVFNIQDDHAFRNLRSGKKDPNLILADIVKRVEYKANV